MNEFRELNKKKLREMTLSKKLQYFKDYYLLAAALIAAGVLLAAYFLYVYFRPQPVLVLTVAVFDSAAQEEGISALEDQMRDVLDAHGRLDQILIRTDYLSGSSQDLARLGVLAGAREIDCIVAPSDVFRKFAASGYFVPLTDVFSAEELEGYGDAVVKTAGYAESEEDAGSPDPGSAGGEVMPYGISLMASETWTGCVTCSGEPVIGFVSGGSAHGNGAALVRTLLS